MAHAVSSFDNAERPKGQMNRNFNLFALTSTLILAGCASPSWLASSGRHMQMRNAASNVVVLQITLPTSDNCAYVLKATQNSEPGRGAAKFMSCSDVSASANLHAHADVLDKPDHFVMHIETISLADCTKVVDGLLAGAGRETNEVVSACKEK